MQTKDLSMFLVATPFCRCLASRQPFAISDRPVDGKFLAFRDMRCTICDDGFTVNAYKNAFVPEGRARRLLKGLVKPAVHGLSFQPFTISEIRHGRTHGDCGAPTCTVTFVSNENPNHSVYLNWVDAGAVSESHQFNDRTPPVMDGIYEFARSIGFTKGLAENVDRKRPFAFTDLTEETPDGNFRVRFLLSWNEPGVESHA
jgi:hypothetical protein